MRSAALSEPQSGSVRQKLTMVSPLAIRGSQCSFCASVPSSRMPWVPSPTLMPSAERNAAEAQVSSITISTSSAEARPSPP